MICLWEAFDRIDLNGDGVISRQEFDIAMQRQQQQQAPMSAQDSLSRAVERENREIGRPSLVEQLNSLRRP